MLPRNFKKSNIGRTAILMRSLHYQPWYNAIIISKSSIITVNFWTFLKKEKKNLSLGCYEVILESHKQTFLSHKMSKFGRKAKPAPEGFEYIEPTLTALDNELRESKYNNFIVVSFFLPTMNESWPYII